MASNGTPEKKSSVKYDKERMSQSYFMIRSQSDSKLAYLVGPL